MKSVYDFPIGSIVRLVSGGPEMTVAAHMAYSHLVPIEECYGPRRSLASSGATTPQMTM